MLLSARKKQKQKQHNFLVDFKNHKLSRRERSRAVGIFVIKKKKAVRS